MTVRELIEILSTLDVDQEIFLNEGDKIEGVCMNGWGRYFIYS